MKVATKTSPAPVGSTTSTGGAATSTNPPGTAVTGRDDPVRAAGDDGEGDVRREGPRGRERVVGAGVAHRLDVVGDEDVDLREAPQHLRGPLPRRVPTDPADDERALGPQAAHPGRDLVGDADVRGGDRAVVGGELEVAEPLLVGEEAAVVGAGERDRDRALVAGHVRQPRRVEGGLRVEQGVDVAPERVVAEPGEQPRGRADPGGGDGPGGDPAGGDGERVGEHLGPRLRQVDAGQDEVAEHVTREEQGRGGRARVGHAAPGSVIWLGDDVAAAPTLVTPPGHRPVAERDPVATVGTSVRSPRGEVLLV